MVAIEHSSISQDVVNWSIIEQEELKIKQSWLETNPMGLKAKHLLQLEEKRKQVSGLFFGGVMSWCYVDIIVMT